MITLVSTTNYRPVISIEWRVKGKIDVRAGLASTNYDRNMPMRKEEAHGFWKILNERERDPAYPLKMVLDRWTLEVRP